MKIVIPSRSQPCPRGSVSLRLSFRAVRSRVCAARTCRGICISFLPRLCVKQVQGHNFPGRRNLETCIKASLQRCRERLLINAPSGAGLYGSCLQPCNHRSADPILWPFHLSHTAMCILSFPLASMERTIKQGSNSKEMFMSTFLFAPVVWLQSPCRPNPFLLAGPKQFQLPLPMN